MTGQNLDNSGWESLQPKVSAEAEFLEIINDFGDPLEIIREAISNSIDASATWIRISFSVEEVEGSKQSVIMFADDGTGMTREILSRDFWGLGFSSSRGRKDTNGEKDTIGEKGHGTKIFLRSDQVSVRTQSVEGAYLSECSRPLRALNQKTLHQPRLKSIPEFLPHTGTEITVSGYIGNERSKFIRNVVKDYILWFTKVGSIERVFDIDKHANFKLYLKCIDQKEHEEMPFGHFFPGENSDINKLLDKKEGDGADWYVKRYIWKDERLPNQPEVTFDAIISVEGDSIKRDYNPMLTQRLRTENPHRYRVGDRYGIYLCRDYIPVKKVNEWISGFGSGSNAFGLLHGFVNCQHLKLTANRGDIANTDPVILEELKLAVQKLISKVDDELNRKGLYILRDLQQETVTLQQEKNQWTIRVKNLKSRMVARLDGHLLVEPLNESELFGLLITVHALRPELFEFEPLDYNTTRGIDIIARNKSDNFITEGEHSYVELKYLLQTKGFNHAYAYLRWIICWDFDRNIAEGIELRGIDDNDHRKLKIAADDDGATIYFLDSSKRAKKIQIIRLREYLKQKLGLEFDLQR
jgi:hypothetical protein